MEEQRAEQYCEPLAPLIGDDLYGVNGNGELNTQHGLRLTRVLEPDGV